MDKQVYDSKKELPQEVIGALADAFGKSFITISRWVKANDDVLTSDRAKEVFDRLNIQWSTGRIKKRADKSNTSLYVKQ